ncbi:hypothetical protein [Hoeflea olei]|uniref:Uncharacterized protein n=1 Tax=Hoeflea olei TaxID=1480615 RepID=A0A1C1YZR2_9HYPH|nr:hypothetical protein [Hoeflea olei]OCW58886.1 hypothetical protein AWJ14_21175 [Hoeflea olei]
MPSIQGATYPISALAQSQVPAPPARSAMAAPLAAKPEAVSAPVSGERTLVSNRVNAYLSTERSGAPRSDRDSADGDGRDGEADENGVLDMDEAATYRPGALY